MKEVNKIKLAGTVTETVIRKQSVTYTIVTDAGNAKAYPAATLYFTHEPDVIYRPGDRVAIEAHIQGQMLPDRSAGTRVYQKTLVIDKIDYQKRALLSEADETLADIPEKGGVAGDVNETMHIGRVSGKYELGPNAIVVTVLVGRDSHMSNGTPRHFEDRCDITCYQRQADIVRDLNDGDVIAAAGTVRMLNDKNGSSRWYISCKDVSKVNAEES